MTAFKNFAQAMSSYGIKLNMHEQRHGYARDSDGLLCAVNVSKVSAGDGHFVEQQFTADNEVYTVESRETKMKTEWENLIAKQKPIKVFVGGEFVDKKEKTVRTKNPNGPGFFIRKQVVSKNVAGVVHQGDYVMVSAKPSEANEGYYTLVHRRV